MRIDILISVLTKEISEMNVADEENEIKKAVGETLLNLGYEKFLVSGSDMIDRTVKNVNNID